jgi:hypothetical protein
LQAAAARARVVPLLIRSSMMIAVLPPTSPTTASPDTTPSLRRFSMKAAPTGRPSARARARRKASARFTPPASGDTTTT